MTNIGKAEQRIIEEYRRQNGLGYVLTDEAVLELIRRDIKTGELPAGFEGLALDAQRSSGGEGIFGAGYPAGEIGDSISIRMPEETDVVTRVPTVEEYMAISFLGGITEEADNTVKAREKDSGVISSVVNAWQEFATKEYAKSTVEEKIKDSKEDLALLNKALLGQITKFNFITMSNEVVSFEEMFAKRRGVKFDPKAIEECQQQAEIYATVKTTVEMVNKLQSILKETTAGDVNDQMYPQSAASGIIKAYQMAGIKSLAEMNDSLRNLSEKYKEHPLIKKYGGEFRLAKNTNGAYVIYRTSPEGYPLEATNEELKLITEELSIELDKTLAEAIGAEYKPDATSEEMSEVIQEAFEKYKSNYEESFKKAFGDKELSLLADAYAEKQQQGVAKIEMGLNILSMALMITPGGVVSSSGWLIKGASGGSKVLSGVLKTAQGVQKAQKVLNPILAVNMTLNPITLLEQMTSENGMSEEEWSEWGKRVLQNTIYMSAGMGVSKLAETGAALYKTKALVNTLKGAGKSADDIAAIVKSNPVKFPEEIVKSFKRVDNMSKALQISTESALDISSTYVLNKVMGNGDLTAIDWINSVAFAIMGGTLQKQFASLTTESKITYLQNAFKDIGVSREEAARILQAMDDISAGKGLNAGVNKDSGADGAAGGLKADDAPSSSVRTPEFEKELKAFRKTIKKDNRFRGIKDKDITPDNIEAARLLAADERAGWADIYSILGYINKENKEAAGLILKDRSFNLDAADRIIRNVNADNKQAALLMINDKDFPRKSIYGILLQTSNDNLPAVLKIIEDKDFPRNNAVGVLQPINADNLPAALKMIEDKEFPRSNIASILQSTNADNLHVVLKMIEDKEFPRNNILSVLQSTNADNLPVALKLIEDKKFSRDNISSVLRATNADNLPAVFKIIENKEISKDNIAILLKKTNADNLPAALKMFEHNEFNEYEIRCILEGTNKDNLPLALKMIEEKNFRGEEIGDILSKINADNFQAALKMIENKEFHAVKILSWLECINKDNSEVVLLVLEKNQILKNISLESILYAINKDNKETAILALKKYNDSNDISEIITILKDVNSQNNKLAQQALSDNQIPLDCISQILENPSLLNRVKQLASDKDVYPENITYLLRYPELLETTKVLRSNKDIARFDINRFLMNANKENLEIVKYLTDNNLLSSGEITTYTYITRNSTANNSNFILKMFSDKILDKTGIEEIVHQIQCFPATYAEKLYTDNMIPKDKIAKILASTNLNSDAIKNENLYNLYSKVESLQESILKDPIRYMNGTDWTMQDAANRIKRIFNKNWGDLMILSAIYDKEAINTLFRMRLNKVEAYLTTLKDSRFSPEELLLLKDLASSCNLYGKPFMPKQKLELVHLLKAYKSARLPYDKIRYMIQEGKVDIVQLNTDLLEGAIRKCGLSQAEIDAIPREKLLSWDLNSMHFLTAQIAKNNDSALKDFVRAANQESDFIKYIHDSSNTYGQTNARTKSFYEEAKLDYEKWVNPSKASEVHFVSKDKNMEQLVQIGRQVEEDLNNLMQTPVKGFLKKQFPKYIKGDVFVIPNEILTNKNKLDKFIQIFADTSDKGLLTQVWKRAQGNSVNPDPKISQRAQNTLTILSHFEQRLNDIAFVGPADHTKTIDLTIKMWDRNPQKDIFQGNYSTCCIAMGDLNGHAMSHYILNTAYNMIELVDNTSGDIIGNALCYFAKDGAGNPVFIVDNVEINHRYKPSDAVCRQIRGSIADYASNVSKEVSGRDDIKIYMSGAYNDVPVKDLKDITEQISFLGDTDCDSIYMDTYGGWTNKMEFSSECKLFSLN